jgi:hypothetical protein
MRGREEQDALHGDHADSATVNCGTEWLGWMFLFGVLGIVTTIGLQYLFQTWRERDEFQRSHGWMTEQMRQLRGGEIDCLVDPDPRFIKELVADAPSAAAVRDIYLGGDLSDPQFGRLRELPHLKRVVILFGRNLTAFLQRMHGATTIEQVTFECTGIVRADVDQLASFPHLKSLGIGSDSPFMYEQKGLEVSDLEALRGHPSLEWLGGALPDGKGIEELLRSIPHLREPNVGHATTRKR